MYVRPFVMLKTLCGFHGEHVGAKMCPFLPECVEIKHTLNLLLLQYVWKNLLFFPLPLNDRLFI